MNGEVDPLVRTSDRERQEHLDKLHSLYGLTLGPTNPSPVEKEIATADRASQATSQPASIPAIRSAVKRALAAGTVAARPFRVGSFYQGCA